MEGGGGKTLNEPLHCTLNDELTDRSNVQSYHVPCEPALVSLHLWVKLHLTKLQPHKELLTNEAFAHEHGVLIMLCSPSGES